MAENVLVIRGGRLTAVINSSLYGALEEAKESGWIRKVYGAIGDSKGISKERLLDLMQFPEEKLQLLLQTPATAIGSSRYTLGREDYEAVVDIFRKYETKYVLLNGGNGIMDTCGKIYKVCKNVGIYAVGIPKTINNDIAITDHTPGFGSAARYIAETTAEVGAGVKVLSIHVCVVEAMGRNAGWITVAPTLARKKPGDASRLTYLLERPFNEEELPEDVKRLYEEKGGVVVVTSEGLKNGDGEPIIPPVSKTERATYYGNVSSYLANLVIQKLGIKARNEKSGICGRASIALQSPVDREEAVLAGRGASKAVMNGESGVMVGFIRDETEGDPYRIHVELIPIKEVVTYGRITPEKYINERDNGVTDAFVKWCKLLIGGELKDTTGFKEYYEEKEGGSR